MPSSGPAHVWIRSCGLSARTRSGTGSPLEDGAGCVMSPSEELTKLVQSTTGPSPLYWETFPELRGFGGRRYRWRFHGHQEGLRGVVTLAGDGERGRARLALNPKCRPFL